MLTTRARRRARRGLIGAALVLCVLVVASCQAILGTEGYQGSADALCELLNRCYADGIPGCTEAVGADITAAEPGVRTTWLGDFSDRACLESCASARRCLDLKPVCGDEACSKREDCCGFTLGSADCDLETKRCCAPRGVRCETFLDCCTGTGDCINNVCGGVPCGVAGEPCALNAQCCSGVCRDKVCAEEKCFEDGFSCADDKDCCTEFCNPSTKTCGRPACAAESAPCVDDVPCCDGLLCKGGLCSQIACSSEGVECSTGDDCCGKRCDTKLDACLQCVVSGAPCEASGDCCSGSCKSGQCEDCLANGDPCDVNANTCCSGTCDGKVCVPACGKIACSHTTCEVGVPLPKEGCSACATAVCAEDPYCCCKGWDSVCVSEAAALCADPCQ